MTYYDRAVTQHVDGTPVFKTATDRANEDQVAATLADRWGCELRQFGELSPVDWFAVRDGRVVGVVELKARPHPSTRYDTVFLNVRKWLALLLTETGLGVPAVFVVQFSDGMRWIRVRDVGAQVRMGGCTRTVKARSDVEPVIEVPVESMREV